MKRSIVGLATVVVLVMSTLLVAGQEKMTMTFGSEDDLAFANMLWKAMKGYPEWPIKSEVYVGISPHGDFLRMYYNMVSVDGKPYHVIVKDNFMGKDTEGNKVDLDTVAKSPMKYLAAVTVMVQREAGYDADNNDWFYAEYQADGTIIKNDRNMMLAGRVDDGNPNCIACHEGAKGNDYLFFNDDKMASPTEVGAEIGQIAPGFQVAATNGGYIKLSDLKGSWVVLCFYPKSFSGA